MARKKGSRNKGFWFRNGCGWYAGSQPLLDAQGKHIKDPAAKQDAQQAYHAFMASAEKPKPQASGKGFTVREVCHEYLKEAKANNSPHTHALRKRLLQDFCDGQTGVRKGCGDMPVAELIGLHVKQWLESHQWGGTRRMAQQAVRRAFNYGKELGMVPAAQILGIKTDQVRKRRAYFDKKLEETLYASAPRALADVIHAMIRTGCRPGEIAGLEKRHIEHQGDRMLWRFPPTEHKTGSKTKRDRVVPVGAKIAALVEHRLKWQTGNRVFLNTHKKPWTADSLKNVFTYRSRLGQPCPTAQWTC